MKLLGDIRNYFGLCFFCGKIKEAKWREMCLDCFLRGKAIYTEPFSGKPTTLKDIDRLKYELEKAEKKVEEITQKLKYEVGMK